MTESAMPDVVKKPDDNSFDAWAPENVAPLVVWLASEASSDITGQIFESQGGRISLCDGWRTGPTFDKGAALQVDEIADIILDLNAQAIAPQKVWGSK